MRDAFFVFTDNHNVVGAQKFMVVEERAGDGVLDSHETAKRGIVGHLTYERVEGVTFHGSDVAMEKFAGGSIVEATRNTLNGDPAQWRLIIVYVLLIIHKKINPAGSGEENWSV